VYVGTNDVRLPGWDPESFGAQLEQVLGFVRERCERVLTATIPLDLGRPRTGAARVQEANAEIERAARAHRALVLDLRDFGARNLIMVDHVHPTAFGQIAIAERALALLERDGMTVTVHPSQLISYSPSRVGRLRGDLTYLWRHALVSARAALIERR
jgi:lysophospholipase L1-like esterase